MNARDNFMVIKPRRITLLWDIMIWFGLIVALLWAVLKTLGYIHSPPWQEALPVYAFAITLIGGVLSSVKI